MGALISYFTFFARFPILRDTPWVNFLGLAVGSGISVWAFVRRRSIWSTVGLGLSTVCAVALIGYVYVLSYQLPDVGNALAVGDVAQDFELPDQDGNMVRLVDFQGSQLLVVFYRGFW